jgi:hypothetical protein
MTFITTEANEIYSTVAKWISNGQMLVLPMPSGSVWLGMPPRM